MNLGAFTVIMATGRTLDSFAGMGRKNVAMGIAMVVFLLSLAGIPPLAGFVGKFMLFGASIDAGFTWLTVVAILNSVLSLAVYLRIVIPMYQQHTDATMPTPVPALSPTPLIKLTWAITLIFTLGIGLGAEALLGQFV